MAEKTAKHIKIDEFDRKIIRELFENARTPISQIARKVRLSKEVVNYRISRLMEKGLLVGFNTVIDIKKIGWKTFFVYARLKNLDSVEENHIIESLKNHKNIAWLVRCIGNYDLILKLFVKSENEAGKVMKDIESSFKIDEYTIDFLSEENAVPFSFIYESNKQVHLIKDISEKIPELEEIDLKILNALAKNARMSISELVEKLNSTREIIRYHLKNLERKKIILKYRPDTLPEKLGYNWYFIILKLGKISEELETKTKTFLLNCENVTYFYKTVGSSDMQIELRVRTTEELSGILSNIRSIFQDKLKRHELLLVLKEHKYTYFPGCMLH